MWFLVVCILLAFVKDRISHTHFPIPYHPKRKCCKRGKMHLEASRVNGLDEIIGKDQCRLYIIVLRYINLSTKSNHKNSKIIQEYKHYNTTVEPTSTVINCLPELFTGDKAAGE
jgi:hypothetical protein